MCARPAAMDAKQPCIVDTLTMQDNVERERKQRNRDVGVDGEIVLPQFA